jgi:hypothetical protein
VKGSEMARRMTVVSVGAGVAMLLLISLAGCSTKSDSDLGRGETAATRDPDPDTTVENERPRLRLRGLGSTADPGSEANDLFTDDEIECLEEAALGDPLLGPLVEDGEELSSPEAQQAIGIIMVDCVGQERIAELMGDAIQADTDYGDLFDPICIETAIATLAPIDVIAILAEPELATGLLLACVDRAEFAATVAAQVAAENPALPPESVACLELEVLLLPDDVFSGLLAEDPDAIAAFQDTIVANCA